jgi:hypothetical protein
VRGLNIPKSWIAMKEFVSSEKADSVRYSL